MHVDIEILHPEKVDVLELAKFTIEAESHLPEQIRCGSTQEAVERFIRDAFGAEYYFVLARKEGDLVGWAGIHAITESMVYFDPWHPLVTPNEDSDDVFGLLVKTSIEHVERIGRNRLEVFLMNLTDDIRGTYERYGPLYESAGMEKGNEWSQMVCELASSDLRMPKLPEGFSLGRISDVSNEEIWSCYNATFLASGDRRYLSQTEAQRRESFENFFDRNTEIEQDASLLLYSGEKIVGFMKINLIQEGGFVNGIGIHPDYRRRGLAKLLMTASIKRAAQKGIERVILEVDIENERAIALYKNLGFRERCGSISHVWTK